MTLLVTVDGHTYCGPVVDLRDRADCDPLAVAGLIRGSGDAESGSPSLPAPAGAVVPPPSALHERAACVRPATALRTRTALAAAGRTLGMTTPDDEAIEDVATELSAIEVPDSPAPPPELPASQTVESLRERVAATRGRIQAIEERGGDPSEAREQLRTAVARLSELETARGALAQRREAARPERDRRERRLELEDALANRRRAARRDLVDRLEPRFVAALRALGDEACCPVDAPPATGEVPEDPFAVRDDLAALAILRIADVRAPVVLADVYFADPGAATDWLDAPVVVL